MQRIVRSLPLRRQMHVLVVPEYTLHDAVTPYHNGVPVNQVRQLKPSEKEWTFWTSSNAFTHKDNFPSPLGFIYIPFGQTWVLKSGKALKTGVHFIAPLFMKVVSIKDSELVTSGVLTASIEAKNGTAVNAYAVAYFKVIDAAKSAFFVDSVTKRLDSERALSALLLKNLESEMKMLNVDEEGKLSDSDAELLGQKLLLISKQKEADFGLSIDSIDVRGPFLTSQQVPDKLRALEVPPRADNAFGAQLSNDYWADVLTPPFFSKLKFGGRKEYITEATDNLVWSIPSPPDFHHFNHVPRMTQTASEVAVKVQSAK